MWPSLVGAKLGEGTKIREGHKNQGSPWGPGRGRAGTSHLLGVMGHQKAQQEREVSSQGKQGC